MRGLTKGGGDGLSVADESGVLTVRGQPTCSRTTRAGRTGRPPRDPRVPPRREAAGRPEAVRAFEAQPGVVLPEPYRTFAAEVCDGQPGGPPSYGPLPLARVPGD
ncbi:hypothetical protein GCM10010282_54040 [Streptomyces roseolus]|nr:hypothetical protein GCM10010282_54040 [Streptomyces roseolus]